MSVVENKVASIESKIDMFIGEMCDRDNQRAEDIREIRAGVSGIQNRIDDMGKHVRNLTVAAIVGTATIVVN